MDGTVPPELQRVGVFGKFRNQTETVYQRWALERAWPAVRVIVWISVVLWAAGPIFIPNLLGLGGQLRPEIWVIAWAINLPTLVVAGLLTGTARRPWMPAAVLTLVTLDTLLIMHWTVRNDVSILMVSMTVFFLFLSPILQMSFRGAAFVVLLATPATAVVAIVTARHDDTWNGTLNFQLWLLGTASVFAMAMTLVLENGSRARFVAEQVVKRQQEELVTSRALIRRYAPPAVADRIEHGDTTVDSAQRRRVTIFFADVVGFTTLADRLDPEALAEIVNEYLGSVAQIIESHGGTLNEFAGDGVMAIFGAPDELGPIEQVLSAISAARELQGSLPEWSRRWYGLGIDEDLQARIGINTGVVSVGTFGSAVRATYTGIGLQTNIAARIQAQCDPGSVLLSKTSWHLVSDIVACRPRGDVEVKGVHFPIAMYEPHSD